MKKWFAWIVLTALVAAVFLQDARFASRAVESGVPAIAAGPTAAVGHSFRSDTGAEKAGAPAGGYPDFALAGFAAESEREAAQSGPQIRGLFGQALPAAGTRFAAGSEDNPLLALEWFWAQRAYPADKIPLDVHDQAIHAELQRAEAESLNATVWTNLGPAPLNDITYGGDSVQDASGRALAVAVHPSNANTILIGSAQGGIWKTTDAGLTFSAKSETMPSLAIKIIRYAPSNPTIVYAATGEPHSSTSIYGQGVLKSINGGDTWTALPASGAGWDFRYASVSGLRVHPTDPNTVYVTTAAIRTAINHFNPALAPQTGIFKSTDGGLSWTLQKASTLYTSPLTGLQGNIGFMDIELANSSPNTLYASEYFGGVWKTTNGGTNWNRVTPVKGGGGPDLPAAVADYAYFSENQATFFVLDRIPFAGTLPEFTRIELGLSQSNTEVIYAGVSTYLLLDVDGDGIYTAGVDLLSPTGLLFKSINGGTSWTWLGDWTRGGVPNYCSSQCNYDNAVEVNPTNANDVLIGGSANYPQVWPDPLVTPTRYLVLPWRGMVYRSLNGGTSWTDTTPHCTTIGTSPIGTFNGLPAYGCSPNLATKVTHPDVHGLAYDPTGQQKLYVANDGGFYRAAFTGTGANPTDYTWENLNNTLSTLQFYWFDVHPTNASILIGGLQDNSVAYWNGTTWEGWGFGDGIFGAFDPVNPLYVYMGTQFNVHRHDNGGEKDALAPGSAWHLGIFTPQGGDSAGFVVPFEIDPVTPATVYAASTTGLYRSTNRGDAWGGRVNGSPLDGTPTSISVSPANHNNVFVATSNGWVYYYDFGASMVHQRGATLPARYLTDVEASANNANTLYVAFSGYNSNTPTTPGKVFKSIDLGVNFTNISGNLPDVPVSAIAVDPGNEQRIWAGTDVGVFQTTDGGATWTSYRGNMPVVAIMDMKYNPTTDYLTVATHGRGIWRINPDGGTTPTTFKVNLPFTLSAYSVVPPPPPLPVFQNADFELGHTAWSELSTNFPDLLVPAGSGSPPAHSGTWLGWLGGADDEISDLSQSVSIPAGTTAAYVKLYYQIGSSETDCSTSSPPDYFEFYVNNTAVEGYVLCNTFNTSAWQSLTLDTNLAAYAGQTVTLHFKVFTDSSLVSSFFIDTTSFTNTPPVLVSSAAPGELRTLPGAGKTTLPGAPSRR